MDLNKYENFVEVENKKELRYIENVPVIQIISDDVSMIILLKDTLEEKGWIVLANTAPEAAISQYFDVYPDCVIIDIDLPNISSLQILNDLQQHNHQQFVPKIIISLLHDRKTRIHAYKMGADDYMEKPIDLEEFTVRVEHLF